MTHGTWELQWMEVPLVIWLLLVYMIVEVIRWRRRRRDGD